MLIITAGGSVIIATTDKIGLVENITMQEKIIVKRFGKIKGNPSINMFVTFVASLVIRDISPPVSLPVKKETDRC